MNISKVKLIYFSPTGTTQKIIQAVSSGIGMVETTHLNLTSLDLRSQPATDVKEELAVIAVPVYGGRVPPAAAASIKKIKARHSPAVIMAVYGNREFEDALVELKNLALNAGFTPIAGGAFIGEHSFSTEEKPIAPDRPDADDLKKAEAFGQMIRQKIDRFDSVADIPPLDVPGNVPYKENPKRPPMSPSTQPEICILCGECVAVCPTEAIALEEVIKTDADQCILCCACIKTCPTKARIMDAEPIKRIADWLYENYSRRKEPELFGV